MKKPTVAFVALYFIFTISGTTCIDDVPCKSLYENCGTSLDCCYQKCSFSFIYMRSVCSDNRNIYNSLTPYFNTNDQQGYCLYEQPTDRGISDDMYNSFGLNVAHPALQQDTRVEVIINGKKLIATVNNHRPITKGIILELSREVAQIMDIKNGMKVRCEVFVPVLENNMYFKYLVYVIPYLCIFTFIFGI